MYKTVRKGDASLQYTILPQTDQFSASGFPQTSNKPRPKIIKYTMGTLMVLIILSCVATPFLMNQNDHSLFASSVFAMGRVSHNTAPRNFTKSQTKDIVNKNRNRIPASTVLLSTEVPRRKDIQEGTTSMSSILRAQDQEIEAFTSAENLATTTKHPTISTEAASSARQISASSIPSLSGSSVSSITLKVSTSVPTESTKASSSLSRKSKMPRVTLKLRENETIPQMYMKAGIASYKKGNITTSVLAHSLSLERLIFKTPEGTIKPWPQKWFFTDPSSDFQWKGSSQMPVTIYIVLAGLATMASISIILMFYVQRKASKRQRQSVEEPEVEGHEEDKSTLLGGESQEAEEKE